jgi:hypothetical protein
MRISWLKPLISALHFGIGPAHISDTVISIHINAINGMPWRGFGANMGQELFEGLELDPNATPAIIFIAKVSTPAI